MSDTNLRVDWYRVPLTTEQLRQLSAPDDWKGFKQAGGTLALLAATAALPIYLYLHHAWYWLIPALILHGSVTYTTLAGVHELGHERVFKTPWLNKPFLYVMSFLMWWNPRFFQLSHNEHHKFTLHQPDDLEVILPMKFKLRPLLRVFLIDPISPYYRIKDQIRHIRRRYVGPWEQAILGEASPATQRWVAQWSWVLLLGHGAILLVAALTGLWILPVVLSLGMFYAGGLGFLMHASQHVGLVDQVNDFRLCCRTIYLNPVFRFLYWNMNYHTEHHMYPAVPCYNLPALHEAIKHEMPRARQGLFETWVEIAYIHILQRYEPSFEYRVPLPTDPQDACETVGTPTGPVPVATIVARVWECSLCGFIYDEQEGLPEEGLAPGTRWEDIPDDWRCPVCGVSKDRFRMVEITREAAAGKIRLPIESVG